MSEKEKYSQYIITVNGKEMFGHDLKTFYEDTLFGDNPEKAMALIKDDMRNISLFSEQYLSAHMELVLFVINAVFESALEEKYYKVFDRDFLIRIPYGILRNQYSLIMDYVSKDGLLLCAVPEELQNEFVQIPYEAVKQNSHAVLYASKEALLEYPDISLLAIRDDNNLYKYLPLEVRVKYQFKEKNLI